MLKSELMAMKPLMATPKMMNLARTDQLHTAIHTDLWGNEWKRECYQYGMFFRCMVEGDRLKLAIYFPEPMKLGAREPAYEVFIDRKERRHLTFDYISGKWRTAMLDHLDYPSCATNAEGNWISDKDAKLIQDFLGTEARPRGVLQYQRKLCEEALERRHRRETDPWDEDLKRVPALPKDWMHWVDKVGIPENFIFYRYKRGVSSGYCSYCEKEVPIHKPRHNKEGRCPRCGRKIVYKAVGRMGPIWTESVWVYLLQRCKDGFLIREFKARRHYSKGEYLAPEIEAREIRRVIYDAEASHPRAYYWGDYKHRATRWIATAACSPGWSGDGDGAVYGKTIPTLAKKELRMTGLPEIIRKGPVDPEKYLAVLECVPMLEQLAKAGLYRMVRQCTHRYYDYQRRFGKSEETALHRILGVSQQALKRLRNIDGGLEVLDWLQFERVSGKPMPDEVIAWLWHENICYQNIQFIVDRMSVPQIANYVQRQMRELGMTSREVLITWTDYLSMATRFGMNVNDEIVYKVRKLKLRHDELAQKGKDRNLTIRAGEILKKYPHVEKIYNSIKEKFEYAGEPYMVVVPEKIEDIILEGDHLNHCIANSERYWERIERRESYLLFLRKTQEPERSYYTLEVEPNGTVRQVRTEYDRQNEKDIKDVRAFLLKWQNVVAKRIDDEDRKLAQVSKLLRLEEFAQMRTDRVIIHTGNLAGHLLVDVLTRDLMENAA